MADAAAPETIPAWKREVTPKMLMRVSVVCFLAWVSDAGLEAQQGAAR
jgi:hypothetical protein